MVASVTVPVTAASCAYPDRRHDQDHGDHDQSSQQTRSHGLLLGRRLVKAATRQLTWRYCFSLSDQSGYLTNRYPAPASRIELSAWLPLTPLRAAVLAARADEQRPAVAAQRERAAELVAGAACSSALT